MTDARWVAMGNRGCACGGRDSRRHDVLRWSSLIGLRNDGTFRFGVMSRKESRFSGSCAGDVRENGRVLGNENGECESPAWIDLATPW